MAGRSLGPEVLPARAQRPLVRLPLRAGENQIAGETTPDYSILGKRMISHVHDIMPETKTILMMRNPVERPWSVADMGAG